MLLLEGSTGTENMGVLGAGGKRWGGSERGGGKRGGGGMGAFALLKRTEGIWMGQVWEGCLCLALVLMEVG